MGMSRITPPGCKEVGNEVPELRVTYQPKLCSIEGKTSLVSQMWFCHRNVWDCIGRGSLTNTGDGEASLRNWCFTSCWSATLSRLKFILKQWRQIALSNAICYKFQKHHSDSIIDIGLTENRALGRGCHDSDKKWWRSKLKMWYCVEEDERKYSSPLDRVINWTEIGKGSQK